MPVIDENLTPEQFDDFTHQAPEQLPEKNVTPNPAPHGEAATSPTQPPNNKPSIHPHSYNPNPYSKALELEDSQDGTTTQDTPSANPIPTTQDGTDSPIPTSAQDDPDMDVFAYIKQSSPPPPANLPNPFPNTQNGTKYAPMVPMEPSWHRAPGESDVAFEAFQMYLEVMSELAGKRGAIAETGRRLGKSESQMRFWQKEWDWTRRQRDYETHNALILEAEQRRAMRKEAQKWAEKRSKIRERGWEIGEKLLSRAEALLNLPIAQKEVKGVYVDKATGEEIPTVTVLNFQSHPRDARLFIETGLKTMRLSADMSTENVSMVVPDEVDFNSMSMEDLEAYADRLIEMRKVGEDDK